MTDADKAALKLEDKVKLDFEQKKLNFEKAKFEYDQLRKEILHNDQLALTRMQFTMAAFGVVCSGSVSGLKNELGYFFAVGTVFAVLLILSFTGSAFERNRLMSTYTIASYLQCFAEPHAANWETRLSRFRTKSKGKTGVTSLNVMIYAVIGTVSAMGASWGFLNWLKLYLWIDSKMTVYNILTIAIASVSVAAGLSWQCLEYNKAQKTHTTDLVRQWNELKANMEAEDRSRNSPTEIDSAKSTPEDTKDTTPPSSSMLPRGPQSKQAIAANTASSVETP